MAQTHQQECSRGGADPAVQNCLHRIAVAFLMLLTRRGWPESHLRFDGALGRIARGGIGLC